MLCVITLALGVSSLVLTVRFLTLFVVNIKHKRQCPETYPQTDINFCRLRTNKKAQLIPGLYLL
jgi:hypothetical protein